MGYTAAQFVERLEALRSPDATGPDDYHGVGMGQIFSLARECMDMAPAEIERLLESPTHAVRVGAVSIMDFQARDRKTSPERKRELFELYLRRHDRIDTWDLVDRSAIWVVGEYLVDKPRDVLDQLAASDEPMERRTAILATFAFIRRDQLDDAYRIAELLVDDPEDTVHKAVGWMLREAGKRDAGTAGRVPRGTRGDDAASDAPLRDREARQADPRPLAREAADSMRPDLPGAVHSANGPRQVGPCRGDDRRHHAVGRPVDHLGPGGTDRGSFGAPSLASTGRLQIGSTAAITPAASPMAMLAAPIWRARARSRARSASSATRSVGPTSPKLKMPREPKPAQNLTRAWM